MIRYGPVVQWAFQDRLDEKECRDVGRGRRRLLAFRPRRIEQFRGVGRQRPVRGDPIRGCQLEERLVSSDHVGEQETGASVRLSGEFLPFAQ